MWANDSSREKSTALAVATDNERRLID